MTILISIRTEGLRNSFNSHIRPITCFSSTTYGPDLEPIYIHFLRQSLHKIRKCHETCVSKSCIAQFLLTFLQKEKTLTETDYTNLHVSVFTKRMFRLRIWKGVYRVAASAVIHLAATLSSASLLSLLPDMQLLWSPFTFNYATNFTQIYSVCPTLLTPLGRL